MLKLSFGLRCGGPSAIGLSMAAGVALLACDHEGRSLDAGPRADAAPDTDANVAGNDGGIRSDAAGPDDGGDVRDAGPGDGGHVRDAGPRDAGPDVVPPPARFEETALVWTVPRASIAEGFWTTSWLVNSEVWSTFDIDGDGRPDLVQTADPSGERSVWGGDTAASWRVFRNTGSGFATTPTTWAVPRADIAEGFWTTSWLVNSEAWSTFDIDGDGRPDLVQTADPSGARSVWGGDTAASWRVFRAIP
jgi:hypothetical protein